MIRFFKSFFYAARGIFSCLKTERNMRVHFCAAFYTAVLMPFYGFSAAEKCVVFLTVAAVIAAEAMNTAVEALTDKACPERSRYAELAKDASSGAVLVTAVGAAAVGFTLFFKPRIIKSTAMWFLSHKLALIGMIATLVGWVIIITRPVGRQKYFNSEF